MVWRNRSDSRCLLTSRMNAPSGESQGCAKSAEAAPIFSTPSSNASGSMPRLAKPRLLMPTPYSPTIAKASRVRCKTRGSRPARMEAYFCREALRNFVDRYLATSKPENRLRSKNLAPPANKIAHSVLMA
jgi:hypothetical protein